MITSREHPRGVRAKYFLQHLRLVLSYFRINIVFVNRPLNFNDNLCYKFQSFGPHFSYLSQLKWNVIIHRVHRYIRNFDRLVLGWIDTERRQDIDDVPQSLQMHQGSSKRR